MASWVTSWAFQGQCSSGEGTTPLGEALPGCLCGTSSSSLVQTPLSYLFPLLGSQHPSSGLFSPMEVRTDHLPMCTCPTWYLSVGNDPAHQQLCLHGLISHRDHSNVNHISSSILLNMCIKSLIHQLKAQRHYTSLQYKFGEKDKASYWASVHWKKEISRKRPHPSHVSG